MQKTYSLVAKKLVDKKPITVLFPYSGARPADPAWKAPAPAPCVVLQLTIKDASIDRTLNPALKAKNIKKWADAEVTQMSGVGREQAFFSLVKLEERVDDGPLAEIPQTDWMIRFKTGCDIPLPDGSVYHVHQDALVRFINTKADELAAEESALFTEDEGN